LAVGELDYGYLNGRLRAAEVKLLDRASLFRLAEAGSFEEMMSLMGETPYGRWFPELGSDSEGVLHREWLWTLDEFGSISPNRALTDLFRAELDFHNLRVLLKGRLAGGEGVNRSDLLRRMLPGGTVSPEALLYAVESGSLRDLPPAMASSLEGHLEWSVDSVPHMEAFLDGAMFEYMSSLAFASGEPFAVGYVRLRADLENLRTAFRLKVAGADVGSLSQRLVRVGALPTHLFTGVFPEQVPAWPKAFFHTPLSALVEEICGLGGDLGALELALDRHMLSFLSRARFSAFGGGPLVAYLHWKRIEIYNLRAIMVGKRNGVSPEEIRRRLRYLE